MAQGKLLPIDTHTQAKYYIKSLGEIATKSFASLLQGLYTPNERRYLYHQPRSQPNRTSPSSLDINHWRRGKHHITSHTQKYIPRKPISFAKLNLHSHHLTSDQSRSQARKVKLGDVVLSNTIQSHPSLTTLTQYHQDRPA